MKRARAYVEQGNVLSSYWVPPLLRGVVQNGDVSFRASLVINGPIDMENLCTCREAREWGKICGHVVAVGIHYLKGSSASAHASHSDQGKRRAAECPLYLAARKASSLRMEEGGEDVELHLLFPPNVPQAASRGKIMLVFEAKWAGGRCPLNALPKGRSYAFSEADQKIIEQIEIFTRGETPAVVQLGTDQLEALLPLLAGHEGLSVGRTKAVSVSGSTASLPLKATLESNGEITLALKSKPTALAQIGNWLWNDGVFSPAPSSIPGTNILNGPVRISRGQVPVFLSQQWPQIAAGGQFEANFKIEDFVFEPRSPVFLLDLKGGLAQLTAFLQCAYGQRFMTLGVTAPDESIWLPDPANIKRYSTRDLAAEREALGRLQKSGFIGPDANGRLVLSGQNAVLNFFARDYPKLQREWKVSLEEKLEHGTMQKIERIQPQFNISSGVQWFDLGVVFSSSGGETFPAAEIQRLLRSGQSHTKLKNGKFAVIDTGAVEELQEVLVDASPEQHGGGYRIANAQAGFIETTLRQNPQWKVSAPTTWRDRAARISGAAQIECPPLGPLEEILRPYQKQGVAWLSFLRQNGFGGILADEMGLGKTLQALAFLNSLPKGSGKPHLVVCPTSLVFNWIAEVKKFTPGLKAIALQGPDRHRLFNAIAENDLVITSYALVRRDAERYRGLQFDTIVLDEAQHIKNRQTQNAQAVKSIRGENRFVLTGTPLENSVLDIWSIFDFLMPGYLGTAQDFRERYEVPITKEKHAPSHARLARRLKPFMLRRLKREVAADLPEKIEQISFCELTADQRAVYQQILEASRKEILEADTEQEVAKTRMMMLTALLRLRQICCDLRLLSLAGRDEHSRESSSRGRSEAGVWGSPPPHVGGYEERLAGTLAPPEQASGKIEMFSELLEEIIDGGHRVLVFSQFVTMLGLLKEKLAAENISFCYLDGSTTDRGSVVQKFQSDATIPVFLISLKAGGVGLNLTAADTVVHFDPWWNPAVEDQATDRAHRIGQARLVTSYKLIARDTVEEKILTLQTRKREIIKATLEGEEQFAASLTMEEMRELLS